MLKVLKTEGPENKRETGVRARGARHLIAMAMATKLGFAQQPAEALGSRLFERHFSPAELAEQWNTCYYMRTNAREITSCTTEETDAEAQVLRVSMLYALLDRSDVIRRDHLEAALSLWRYCEDSARHVFGDALGNPVADEILRALRDSSSGLTRTQINELFGRNRIASEIARALSVLLQQGFAGSQTETTGGRNVERWFAKRRTKAA